MRTPYGEGAYSSTDTSRPRRRWRRTLSEIVWINPELRNAEGEEARRYNEVDCDRE